MHIEPLEPRIAPASVLLYTDIDGDKVTITSSSGELAGHATISSAGQLELLSITAPAFNGADIKFKVAKAASGDGFANVGRIDGGLNNLGAVVVKGDLGQIDTGSGTGGGPPALALLKVRSLGIYGLATQGGTGDLTSIIAGALGTLKVAGDVKDATIGVSGGAFATLGSVLVGGSLVGTSGDFAAEIFSEGNMGTVTIRGDVRGGPEVSSGTIVSLGDLASLTIGGSLIGGTGDFSGQIGIPGKIGAVTIGHDVRGGAGRVSGTIQSSELGEGSIGGSLIGGAGNDSGSLQIGKGLNWRIGGNVQGGSGFRSGAIASFGDLGSLTIGGSLIGGSDDESGEITVSGDLEKLKIGGDVQGGSISGSDSLDRSGDIRAEGRIGKVVIGGSMVSGIDQSSGVLARNASLQAGDDIGSLKVKGGLIGNSNSQGFSPVIIAARGQVLPTANTDLAIGHIEIGGSVSHALILAGYDSLINLSNTAASAVNGNAQIGAVSVGGSWIASSIAAGVKDTANNGLATRTTALSPAARLRGSPAFSSRGPWPGPRRAATISALSRGRSAPSNRPASSPR